MYHVEASRQPYSSFRALCFKQGAPHSLSSRSFVAALRPRRLLTAQPQRAPYPDPDFPVGVPGSDQPDIRHWERLGEIFKSLSFPSQCNLIACQSWTTSSLFTWVIGVDRGQILTSQVPPRLFSEPDADPTSRPAFASKIQVRFAKPRSRNNSTLASAANGPVMAGPVASVTRPPRPKPG